MTLKPRNSNFIILFVSAVASFITAFMGSAINVAIPEIGKEFASSAVLLSWIATAYILTSVVLLIPAGKISDIYGRVKLFKIGIVIFTASSMLVGFSDSIFILIFFRAVQGIGTSLIFINSFSILVSAYPPDKRGRVLGVVISAIYTGLSAGPFLGGFITDLFGWRYIFYISFLLSILLTFMAFFFMKCEWKVESDAKLDIKGSLLFSLSMALFMFGFSGIPKIWGFAMLGSGIILFYIYKKFSETISDPVLNLDIFKSNRSFTLSNISALINYSATFAISFLLSIFLQNIKGLSPEQAGTVLVTQPVFMAVFSPIAGRLSDKIEPQYVSSAGMLFITVCLGFLGFISADSSITYFIILLAILGIGFALFSSPNSNAIMSSVDKKYIGTASTVLSLMRMMGQMFSMAIVIVIFSVVIGKAEITPVIYPQLIGSTKIAFLLFAFLCFLGIFASLSRGKIHD
jgi:EmrB/QacA subfamily drug resistance transporter